MLGKVKRPCADCVNGYCTMNCSGAELALVEPDHGTLIVTYEKDGRVTVVARRPHTTMESKVNLAMADWLLVSRPGTRDGSERGREPS